MSNGNFFENETFNLFYKMIEDMVDRKIANAMQNGESSEYGVIISATNNEDNTKTISAVVEIIKNGIQTGEIKNNTNDMLAAGDKVRVTSVNGNWSNSYISLKCGITN